MEQQVKLESSQKQLQVQTQVKAGLDKREAWWQECAIGARGDCFLTENDTYIPWAFVDSGFTSPSECIKIANERNKGTAFNPFKCYSTVRR